MSKYTHVLEQVYGSPWLITENGLKTITDIIERKLNGESLSDEELALAVSGGQAPQELELPTSPSVGVLPIHGSLFPRANMFSSISGGSSVEQLRTNFKQMLESDMVTSILLDINSPGGKADMIAEFANDIYNARGKKPIIASVNSLAASAGYYLASQADEIYATDSGIVGSIGVIAVHQENSKAEADKGITTTVFTSGEYKGIGNPHQPLTETDKFHLQEQLDETYTEFIDAVARGRGVDTNTVLTDYGKGLVYKTKKALGKGMIDGIETYDATLARLSSGNAKFTSGVPTSNEGRFTMSEGLTAEALEILELAEDATDEELNAAILSLSSEAKAIRELKSVVQNKSEFATMFPEQAAKMAELEAQNLKQEAKLFSDSYAKFSREDVEFGFSALVLDKVADMHMSLASDPTLQASFKEVLDLVATGDAVVQYGEVGSKRGKEEVDTSDLRGVMDSFAGKISEVMKRDSIDWESATQVAATENPDLATAYAQSYSQNRG